MNDPVPTSIEAPQPKPTLRDLVAKLRAALEHADPGTLAALRRFKADALPPAAFYRLTVPLLDDSLPESGEYRDAKERQWGVIVAAMASAQGFLAAVPLGEALAKAGVAEMRVLRLLEASAEQLPSLVRTVVHQLIQKGQPFDPTDLASLVLAADDNRAPRRKIAQSFYRHADA